MTIKKLLTVFNLTIFLISSITNDLFAINVDKSGEVFPSYFFDITETSGIGFTGYLGHTASWGDYNNDGCLDLFISNTDNSYHKTTYLYENYCNGSFYKLNDPLGIQGQYPIRTSNWADYDNDGILDLIIGGIDVYMNPYLYKNHGGNIFEDVSILANIDQPGAVNSIIWLDYDLDGYIDMFESTFSSYLYRNRGDGSFEDVTYESGISEHMKSIKSSIAFDYNNDLYPDLILLYKNNITLFRNNGNSTFTDVTGEAGLIKKGKYRYSAACIGDFNNDGNLDLYLVNIGSPNNLLYQNNGDGTFQDITKQSGTSDVGDGRTCSFVDYDSDGLLDIFTTNHINPTRLYKNVRNGRFRDVAWELGIDKPVDVFSATWGDFNGDAIMDVFLNGHIGIALYKGFNLNNSVVVELVGDGINTNTSAIGSRVELRTESKKQVREILGGKGCCENDMLPAHFGLGQESEFELTIKWTSGKICKFDNLNAETERIYKVWEKGCEIFSY